MSITINGSGSITGVSSVESIPASDVDFTPSGNISATTVQAALADIAGNSGASKIGYTPAGTGAVATTVQSKLRETVSVKDFGAVGDGATDDTAAFVAANNYLMTKELPPTNQLVESQYVTLEIPEGIYKITGHRIFGSQIATGSSGTAPPRMIQVLGRGATLMWDVQNEDDELFYFDGTIANPKVQGLSIFTTRSSIINSGVGVIFRFYANTALTNQANASKLHLSDVSVWPGRRTSGGNFQRTKYVFLNTGNATCDQMLIDNCRFSYMQKVWVGQNDQAVNITFNTCSFAGLSNDGVATATTYFDFTRMNDNFNVVNCSFSVQSGETLLKTTSPQSGGYYAETAGYNFNFDSNRIEIINGSGANTEWTLCRMNFGKFNFRNTNLKLGNGVENVKTVVRVFELANLNFDNIQFNRADFFFPVAWAASYAGALNSYGAYLHNCQFLEGTNTTFGYTDGGTDYALKDILISTALVWRGVRFVDCHYLNSNGFRNWEFACSKDYIDFPHRRTEKVAYAKSGVAFGRAFQLPPYQTIKRITLSMVGGIPDTYDKFRVWIGDRTLGNYIDIDNIRPDIRKNEYVLFAGDAAVFYSDFSKQTIEVAALNSGVEQNAITSSITVEYVPIDAVALGITSNADQIKQFRTNRDISSGVTSQRPNIDLYAGQSYFDTQINKPIWWTGSVWKDAAGTNV